MLEIENIHKNFRDFRITGINLKINAGDYYVILGKSGAGKTILLETIAGLLNPEEGSIKLKGKNLLNKSVQARKVGLVFQDYAIFPHKSVFENIAYPLKKKKSRREIKTVVSSLARKTGTEHILHRFPSTLSGGEVQRTVLARTLALEPEVLLLDEPLASLDIQYKRELQSLLRKINEEGQTIIHVSHDYEEALALANRVAVMNNGKIIQEGEIHEVFRNPKNKFIADFVGIRNFFIAVIQDIPGSNSKLARINETVALYIFDSAGNNQKKIVTIDGRNIVLSYDRIDSTALNSFHGTIVDIIPVVNGLEIIVDIGVDLAVFITEDSYRRLSLAKGKNVWVSFKASAVQMHHY